MSTGVVALLLGIGMVLALRSKMTGLGVFLGVIFGFVLALTPLGGPVNDALNALGEAIAVLVTE
ncbi:MAG TPA: hypothetical protein VKY71_00460 [Actinotalea caeni]|uniref:hypothetical protein n=1 Tax=Actinotalea caeni TaxID=1348467 RepID=UPI0012E2B191|nr:hypothetical protein [Actinotalea caeni]HLV54025.1 hypothetical protein [Actinotalea caeni]